MCVYDNSCDKFTHAHFRCFTCDNNNFTCNINFTCNGFKYVVILAFHLWWHLILWLFTCETAFDVMNSHAGTWRGFWTFDTGKNYMIQACLVFACEVCFKVKREFHMTFFPLMMPFDYIFIACCKWYSATEDWQENNPQQFWKTSNCWGFRWFRHLKCEDLHIFSVLFYCKLYFIVVFSLESRTQKCLPNECNVIPAPKE